MNATERFKKVMNILDKNDLSNCSRNYTIFEQIKDEDLDNEVKVNEVIEIIQDLEERIEHNTNKYPEYIMGYLRQRAGLDEFDTSKDIILSEMQPSEVFSDVCIWNGLINYDYTIKEWIKDIYKVNI